MLAALLMGLAASGINRAFVTWAVSASAVDPLTATAAIRFNTDGTITKTGSGNGSLSWFTPTSAGIGSSFWVKLTATSGAFSTNAASSFVQMSSNRLANLQQIGAGSAAVTFTIEIASDSGGSNLVFTRTGNTLSCVVT
jgi:hypothetical protein